MKKFRYAFPIPAYVVYALLLLLSAVSVLFAALRLGNAGGFFSVYPVSDVLSIVVFSIAILAVLWLSLFSNYAFSGDTFVFTRLFLKKRVNRQDIIKLVTDEESGVSALYYYGSVPGERNVDFLVVCVGKGKRDAFERALREFKSDIVIESNPKGQAD